MTRRDYKRPAWAKSIERAGCFAAVKRRGRRWRVCNWLGPAWFAVDVEWRVRMTSWEEAVRYVGYRNATESLNKSPTKCVQALDR